MRDIMQNVNRLGKRTAMLMSTHWSSTV